MVAEARCPDEVRAVRVQSQRRPLDGVRAIRDEIERQVIDLIERSLDEIRACTEAMLERYADVAIRSFVLTLASREARECLTGDGCRLLAPV